jgi:4-amino-4-deoxy-L-arabinose transferase-like glycosyltransferase
MRAGALSAERIIDKNGMMTSTPNSNAAAWRFPFADGRREPWKRSTLLLLLAYLVCFHVGAIQIAQYLGTYRDIPSNDYLPAVKQILAQGYTTVMHTPPGFPYYLAMKWSVANLLHVPFAFGKYTFDLVLVLLAVWLSYRLAHILTRNRTIALVSALTLVHAPIYILGVGYEEAALFFLPFFLLTLIILARELQRPEGVRLGVMALTGALNGLASLIRGNTQFFVLAIVAILVLLLRRSGAWKRPITWALPVVFLLSQSIVMSPWTYVMRSQGRDGLAALPAVYMSYFDGLTRYEGNRVCDWILVHYKEPKRSLEGVVDFNIRWLKEDPYALAELYVLKFVKSWYISESGRWNTVTLIVHAPLWILAVLGFIRWRRTRRGDPAYLFLFCAIVYMWSIASIMGAIARYSAPLYGMIGIFIGVALEPVLRRLLSRWHARAAVAAARDRIG